MAKGINKVILIGNLGANPERRYLPSGSAVTNISLATTDSWLNKESNAREEKTEWHRVVFFNRLAEIAGEYLKKGSKVYVEGRLQTRKYQDQNGIDRYMTEIIGLEMQMLDSRQGATSHFDAPPDIEESAPHLADPESTAPVSNKRPAQKISTAAAPAMAVAPLDDDDVPF